MKVHYVCLRAEIVAEDGCRWGLSREIPGVLLLHKGPLELEAENLLQKVQEQLSEIYAMESRIPVDGRPA